MSIIGNDTKKRPLFIVREYDTSILEWSRFLRNVFRALQVVVIISGTDSKSANLIRSAKSFRNDTITWCHFILKLAKTDINAIISALSVSAAIIIPPVFERILQNSRPWFAFLVIKYLKDKN